MAWIESHQSLSRHRKTVRAVGQLRIDRMKFIGHMHELWWWALDNVTPDGALGDATDGEIEAGASWDGEPGAFVAAVTRAGFIDLNTDGSRNLHDWWDYAGKIGVRREKTREDNKQRQAEWRQRNALRNGPDVRDVTPNNVPTVPYPTIPNQDAGRGKGEPSVGPSADAEGAPSASPAADAAPPPAAELPPAQPEREPEPEPRAPTPVPPPPPADPLLPALARLRALPGYRAAEDDLTWLADRARLFGTADALEREIAKCADHWADKDSKSLNAVKPKWRSRLSKWLDNASKFASERSGRVVDLRSAQEARASPGEGVWGRRFDAKEVAQT